MISGEDPHIRLEFLAVWSHPAHAGGGTDAVAARRVREMFKNVVTVGLQNVLKLSTSGLFCLYYAYNII